MEKVKTRLINCYSLSVSEDIRMEFETEKCAVLVMKRRKLVKSEGIEIPCERLILAMNDGDVHA